MPLIQLPASRWHQFFDDMSRAVPAETTKVEVLGFGLGDHVATDASVLIGISYEPAVDTFTLFVEGLQHRVHRPKSIHVDADLDLIHSIEVVDADDVHHIIQFRPALPLPAP